MKKIIVVSFILLIISCKENSTNTTRDIGSTQKEKKKELPVLKINSKKFTEIESLHFNHSVGGKPIEEETRVSLKYDEGFLEIKFECRNNPKVDQNYYTEDNSSMFNQEVFELFISKGKEVQEKYLEIQLNPNNALFLGKITNRFKPTREYKIEYIETNSSGVIHMVEKDSKNHLWKGYLKLPLKLLEFPEATPDETYRINMFRIISNIDQTDKNWSHATETSTFACWNSTMTKTPQFHVPDAFGMLILE
ncbi:carbohydrate-binding family 9-like protein [Aquimarina sp. I32.4]|uniref:carbohydrate-binding family 9-like protein n=1 Tax=Aquimarina sp. I32.4 TaxID=2053903 RepID=UPI000CDE8B59|nr:carbohydrate-binding family 9-like protein [Aquimarina sp. I32.4]